MEFIMFNINDDYTNHWTEEDEMQMKADLQNFQNILKWDQKHINSKFYLKKWRKQ